MEHTISNPPVADKEYIKRAKDKYPLDTINDHIEDMKTIMENFQGKKESENKLFYELDFEFITQMAERVSQNKSKYEKWNWKKPIDVESLKQALFRHTLAVMNGDVSEDHLGAVAVNAMMINYQQKMEIIKSFK